MPDALLVENLWGYAKRLGFVTASIAGHWPNTALGSIRILDVGCGNGSQLAIPLARLGCWLTGIDMHEGSIDEARRLASDLDNVDFKCVDLDAVDDGAFDVVILSEVLEHVADPAALLRSSIKKMKRGGRVIITVPNGYGEFEWDSWLFRGLRLDRAVEWYEARRAKSGARKPIDSSTENHDNGHIQFFTLKRLERIFREAGLVIEAKAGSTLFGGPLAGHTLARSNRFIGWNAEMADGLPLQVASGWYFALRRADVV